MRRGVLIVVLAPAMLVGALGCQRLNFQKQVDLTMGEVAAFNFTPPAYAQKVIVTVAPTDAGVSAYIAKTDDDTAMRSALDKVRAEPAASLLLASRVSKDAPETYTIEATIPAKTAYTLYLRGGLKKGTSVKLSLVGR